MTFRTGVRLTITVLHMDAQTTQPSTARFETYLAALNQFIGRTGHARVPAAHVEEIGGRQIALGAWVGYTRQRFRRGSLAPQRAEQLAGLPGWQWGPLSPGPAADPDRDREILELRSQGLSLQKIADKFNLSRQRVHQIVKMAK